MTNHQRERLLDPTGASGDRDDGTLAPRPRSLRGLTVGLLDNTKPNAPMLLDLIGEILVAAHGVAELRRYVKDYFGTPAKPGLVAQVARECDIVVTAVGDCGSCSAATVADGIQLEAAGVPTVAICSDSFRMSGRAMAQVQGFPGYEFVTVLHPVASLDENGLRDRARDVLPQALQVLGVEA
ncbi:UGSC family (seleno)protein [Microbacterium sediminicola]|uniref:UGSC family (Seleno)protein n=1 Tax=Microbacterium sediminicola TaxID=415210 RepID=A0ABN2HZX6_9MICO